MPAKKHAKKEPLPDVTRTAFKDERLSTRDRWHYRPANGRHWRWFTHNGRQGSYLDACVLRGEISTVDTVGEFRNSHDTFKNRLRIRRRQEDYEEEHKIDDVENDA